MNLIKRLCKQIEAREIKIESDRLIIREVQSELNKLNLDPLFDDENESDQIEVQPILSEVLKEVHKTIEAINLEKLKSINDDCEIKIELIERVNRFKIVSNELHELRDYVIPGYHEDTGLFLGRLCDMSAQVNYWNSLIVQNSYRLEELIYGIIILSNALDNSLLMHQ